MDIFVEGGLIYMNVKLRKEIIRNARRVVVKVGTRLLTDPARIPVLVNQIHKMRQAGKKVLLVTSGAVGTGMRALNLDKRPKKLADVQALAALGQNKLMALYDAECAKLGFHCAQLLLTAEDLRHRERHLNVFNCIESLLADDVLPILNENDTVSVAELKFGDNDGLAALLATMMRAELTVLLTNVDGLFSRNPDGTFGERIPVVEKITDKFRAMASGTDDAAYSKGGMASKLNAASIVTSSGEYLWIACGKDDHVLERMLKGDDIGTVFLPNKAKKPMESKKRWLKFFSKCSGRIIVDEGAEVAVIEQGRSLLPSGIIKVEGKFKRGDAVEICAQFKGDVLGRGLSNFSAAQCRKIAGHQSSEIAQILGHDADEEVIHRNNLAVADLPL